jgi:peptide/nickel transport system permease protein
VDTAVAKGSGRIRYTEPSLGLLIANGFAYLMSGAWWISIFPGVALFLVVLAINLVGDALREALDPHDER